MRNFTKKAAILPFIGVIGIALITSRCSPIASSINKGRLGSVSQPASPGEDPQQDSTPTRVTLTQIHVVPEGMKPPKNSLVFSNRQNKDSFRDFKDNRKTEISLSALPSELNVYLEVSLQKDEIKDNDLTDIVHFKHLADSTYLLSVSTPEPPNTVDAGDLLVDNLNAIIIDLNPPSDSEAPHDK